MSFYFLLTSLTDEGKKLVHGNHRLVVDTARGIDSEGAEILGQYAVLGRYDYVMMVEAEDNDAVARLSLELGVKAGLHIETLPAIAIGFLDPRIVDDPVGSQASVQISPEE